jgi:hypothetical protein
MMLSGTDDARDAVMQRNPDGSGDNEESVASRRYKVAGRFECGGSVLVADRGCTNRLIEPKSLRQRCFTTALWIATLSMTWLGAQAFVKYTLQKADISTPPLLLM